MTTITKDQMLLKENDVYVYIIPDTNVDGIQNFNNPFIFDDKMVNVTHSTAKLEGIIHLQREWFVKREDVEEMANSANGYNYYCKETKAPIFNEGFKAGYNAKKGEFTREEAEALFNEGCRQGTGAYSLKTFNECISILRPLTLPQSLTLNKDNELVKIEW